MENKGLISFQCKDSEGEKWAGRVTYFKEYGNHYEIHIESRSGLTVYFGRCRAGWFACIPDWDAGTSLGSLDDVFYNTEKLSGALNNYIDGLTIATALAALAKELNIEEHNDTDELIKQFESLGFKQVVK